MSRKRVLFNGLLAVVLIIAVLPIALWPQPVAAQEIPADAVVLVNSTSAGYGDFQHYIQPYLDNFGVPYTVHDVAAAPVTEETVERALIIVGHNGLDEAGAYLDAAEQDAISAAVFAGAGLVNFDRLLADSSHVPHYGYVQDVLDLTYGPDVVASSVEIGEGDGGIRINCWEDDHQEPVLATTTNVADLIDDDGEWTEFHYVSGGRPFPSVMAGADEEDYGLPVMRFYASGIPSGDYEVFANLYTAGSDRDMRYYYGYAPTDPDAHYVDTVGGTGGSDQHEEYSLGTVSITDGTFDIYVQDADLIGTDTYPIFGWAWIRLVPEGIGPSPLHYITARHEPDETIGLSGGMTVVGMTPPADGHVVAAAAGMPFIVVREYGQGRAVQWGSYDFAPVAVKGYIYGLDDLVWRSLVWAARKPFVMQGMPPLLPFRIDDCSGPFWWAEDAAAHGLKPWLGFFLHNMDANDAAQMKALVDNGDATASIHAFTGGSWFYYNHGSGDWSDAQIAAHFAEGTQWHLDNEIPISRYVLGHYYELGTNAFAGLSDWGVEFVGTHMQPGTGYGSPWLSLGPYRLYESTRSSSTGLPVYYADFLPVPGHSEFDGQFFNAVTEIRDNAGYEWYPSNDVALSIERGVIQTRRAFDSMALATLFTHEQHIGGITRPNWNAILDGVLDGVASYDPIYVTMEDAAQYVRATVTSDIAHSGFDPHTGVLTATLTGQTDLPTQFYLFTDCGSEILEQRVDVPVFSGSTQVITQLPGELHRIEVSPALVSLGFGDPQQFEAQGYDIEGVPVVCAEYTWDVVTGGGTIDEDGFFTAGTTPGTFVDTVVASDQGITGSATVAVAEMPVDRFAFDPVGDQLVGVPFTVTVTALDAWDLPVAAYDGPSPLADTTGTIVPAVTGPFVDGVWTGTVTIGQAATDVVVSAQDGTALGSSNPFTVTELPPPQSYLVTSDSYTQVAGVPFTVTVSNVETTINLWEDEHQDPALQTFTEPALFNETDGEWNEFLWVGHRDYPGVFGGRSEAIAGTLEVMHFSAEVPNGTYRVVANLYHSRNWRYYWGYTPGDTRAHSVDVTSGPAGDFAEFDLGTITILDSRFDLYTDYAQDLGGTAFPYFGWAWIRLEPTMSAQQVNCWEDDHQDPVLVPFSNPALLNDHDGQWDEFDYPTRDYPSVMAGHDEWENNGIQPMHFYADGIPNGVYEVWANLYTGRHTRHFYGFTEAEALAEARWVDNVADAGGANEHAEYSLGLVEITDGRFDLWAGDGDPIGTGAYFYGWAWLRLVPSGMAMSSSSPTMLFDGDGDGVFGEPGDSVGVLIDGTFDIVARGTTAGFGVVITATDVAGFWGTAIYTVTHAAGVSVEITPDPETVWAGDVVTHTATAEDVYGNTWDATVETDFDIDLAARGDWTGNIYTSEVAGGWTVTGVYGALSNSATLHVLPAAALSLVKASSGDPVRVENPLIYTIIVTNEGPTTAFGVTVTDTLPTGVALDQATSSHGTGCSGTSPVVCTLGDLDSSAAATVTIVVTPTVTGTIANAAQATGVDWAGNPVDADGAVSVRVIDPSVELVKVGEPEVVNAGDTVMYTLTVENTGDSDLNEVMVDDHLVGCVLRGPTGDGGDPGVLDPDELWTYNCLVTAGDDDIVNTATVAATDEAGLTLSQTDTVTVTVIHPAIAVDKVADPMVVNAGDTVAYTVTVANSGDSDLSEVQVDDRLAGCDLSGPVGDVEAPGVLDVGEMWAYICEVTAGGEDIENTAVVTATDEAGGMVSGSATAYVDVINPYVTFEKRGEPGMVHEGEMVTYTITVANSGDSTLSGVVVDDQLPECELSGPGGDTVNAGVLDVGEIWAYTCMITAGNEDILNTAAITAMDEAGGTVSEAAHAEVDVIHPAIEIEKQPEIQTVEEGTAVTFTIEVRNAGDVRLTGVQVTDEQAPQCGRAVGALAAGESERYTCVVEGAEANFTNRATVEGTDPVGWAVMDEDTARVQVEPASSTIYLPVLMNETVPAAPDLVVEEIRATSGGMEVVIKNVGDAPVVETDAFWVDLYVDPDPLPSGVNQVWDSLCDEGMVWGVEEPALPLDPGGTITLRTEGEYYWEEYSEYSGSVAEGAAVYVQVDSADVATSYGAVLEMHEIVGGLYNNISVMVYWGMTGIEGEAVEGERHAVGGRPPASSHHLPPRP